MILIWGMKLRHHKTGGSPSKETIELETRAKILLDILDEEKSSIIVPTVTVAELLAGIDRQDHPKFLAEIGKRFFCPSFDLPAAAIAAHLWQLHKTLPKSEQFTDRRILKADVMLIATAKAAGARVLYSHDASCRKLATNVLEAKDLPTHHPDLFRDKELRSPKE